MNLWRASRTNRPAPAWAGLHLLALSVFNLVQPGSVLNTLPPRDREKQREPGKMTTIRRFSCNDLLRFSSVNLDHLTETFNMSFYMTYLARWPDYFHVAEGPGNKVMGYIMGKVEGQGESWHGHVTAVTVATEYRRQQLAKKLMNLLEEISDKIDKAYFVDLFVRASNTPAIKMYEKSYPFLQIGCWTSGPIGAFQRKAGPTDNYLKLGSSSMMPYSYWRLSGFLLDKVIFFMCCIMQSMRQDDSYSAVFSAQLGYVIYRRVLRYYSGEEDGLDMRKALSRDVEKKSIIPLKRPVTPDELEYD
ncbi:hypothetical protein SADUNF_Sadunf05G0154900 [Salix dunnii]|uniref:N-acetyltransferase domain-containing protein n=1 Tax=Salix dunnii TaxID=1413687 RepID=A0A835KD98_9ROSI|nr:hypothetical protein SADUNF_Sadunf05G0154900 [Salix dunnii]